MKNKLLYILTSLILLSSCESYWNDQKANHTAIFYLPWSPDLISYFYKNLEEVKQAIQDNKINNTRVIVCLAQNSSETILFELKNKKDKCVEKVIKSYINHDFTTVDGLNKMFADIKRESPTEKYSLVISAHGMGWLPVNHETKSQKISSEPKLHFEHNHKQAITRYFGGTTAQYQTEISTLTKAIDGLGIKLEFIAFDDCYMSNIETAYELRNITKHIIASPTEIMGYGFPYLNMTQHLIGETNYKKVCDEFYNFYSNYESPYATLGVIDCQYLDSIVPIMKQINANYCYNNAKIQKMDGYSPPIFYDFGSYVRSICQNDSLLNEFESTLEKLVPHKVHTNEFPTAIKGHLETISIHEYSGITTSDPSNNIKTISKTNTPWYKATH